MSSIKDYKLLTIVIPTYNRSKQLNQCINLILPQVYEHRDDVRLYVSDNASEDETEAVVKKFVDKYPDVVYYYRQPENITASPNFNHAVHSVNSEYVYILGDDDVVSPTFVTVALDLIKHHPEIGLFYFSYLYGNDYYQKKYLPNFFSNTKEHSFKIYSSGKDFISEFLEGPSFISSNLFKRSLWLDGSAHIKTDCEGYVWLSALFFGSLNYPCAFYAFPSIIGCLPSNCRYSINMPWYYAHGLGLLFKYLDESATGIFDSWVTKRQYEGERDFLLTIAPLRFNKPLYKKRLNAILQLIENKSIRRYIYAFYYLPAWITTYILIPYIRSWKLLTILKKR